MVTNESIYNGTTISSVPPIDYENISITIIGDFYKEEDLEYLCIDYDIIEEDKHRIIYFNKSLLKKFLNKIFRKINRHYIRVRDKI